MTDQNTNLTSGVMEPEAEIQLALAELFLPDETDLYLPYDPPATLVPDLDEERMLTRQREMMAYLGDPITEETKPEKRSGLAMQQLGIEIRHGLRLLLGYGDDPVRLVAHLEHCLEDPEYGYGPNADDGRTIAQGFRAIAGDDLARAVADWLDVHAGLREAILSGHPVTTLGIHDYTELESFVPILQRVGDNSWRLGVEGQGKHRDFEGEIWEIWGRISETAVAWYDEDNERWLADVKRQAARLPDTIRRAAWGDRLRKNRQVARLEGTRVVLEPAPEEDEATGIAPPGTTGDHDWPRFLTIAERVGLTRLSGHSFYELSWDGGLRSRHFELSNTTRNKIPFEHTELAVRLAEVVAEGERPDPASPEEVEAAYLRRIFNPRKGKEYCVEMGPPQPENLPAGVGGTPVATYQAGDVVVTILHGNDTIACAVAGETAILLRRDQRRGVVAALQVVRGRVGRQPLMTTPLDELGSSLSPEETRALSAWAAWLAREVESRE
jgi:hypothetical protein